MSHRSFSSFPLLALLTGVAVFAGCSASGAFDGPMDNAAPTDPGVSLPPPSGGGGDDDDDSAIAKDGGKADGGKKEAGVDAGPPPPEPGASCPTTDAIFNRSCGSCGKQEALCEANHKVSEYSACHDEIVGGCLPGSVVNESCGNCGTRKKTCSNYCAWSTTTCAGEVAGGCSAGTVAWSSAGCATVGQFRERSCGAACVWGSYSACAQPDFSVQVSPTIGQTSTIIVPLSPAYTGKRITGSCTATAGPTLSTTDKHNVAFVRVVNPGSKAATVTVYNAQAPGGSIIDTVLTAYASRPTSDDELKACEKGAGDYCTTTTLPCGDSKFGALTGTNGVVVPAGGTRVVVITTSQVQGTAGQVTEGPLLLSVRTDVLE